MLICTASLISLKVSMTTEPVARVVNTAPKKVNCIVNDQLMPNKIRKIIYIIQLIA